MSRSTIRLAIVSTIIGIAVACSSPVAPTHSAVQAAHRNDSGYMLSSGYADTTAATSVPR